MSSMEMARRLTPEMARLVAPFVREYERAREHEALVMEQARAAVAQAQAARKDAGDRMLRAGALAVGGRTDLIVDFDTFEVREKPAQENEP